VPAAISGTIVDSNVILDLFTDDPLWADWSQDALERQLATGPLYINAVVYAEVSVRFERIESLDEALAGCRLTMLPLPRESLFLAGKAFLRYRRQGGTRTAPLPDFFIGAHAAVTGMPLLTRDGRRLATHFPRLRLIPPRD
jgi:predicted nucleic acid-binding protein